MRKRHAKSCACNRLNVCKRRRRRRQRRRRRRDLARVPLKKGVKGPRVLTRVGHSEPCFCYVKLFPTHPLDASHSRRCIRLPAPFRGSSGCILQLHFGTKCCASRLQPSPTDSNSPTHSTYDEHFMTMFRYRVPGCFLYGDLLGQSLK